MTVRRAIMFGDEGVQSQASNFELCYPLAYLFGNDRSTSADHGQGLSTMEKYSEHHRRSV